MALQERDFTLKGIKVIETAQVKAGPMAGRILASWGADVIHIEHPTRGDISRSVRDPNFKKTAMPAAVFIESDINYEEENHNRNKRAMTLDFSRESGLLILNKMLESADILLSNFRPREIEKFNLQYEKLSKKNPRLIFANITGYGPKGPDRDSPAFDTVGFYVRSGFTHSLTRAGQPPPNSPLSSGDHMTGLALIAGIMTALFAREKSGIGQMVEASLLNTAIYALTNDVGGSLVTGKDVQQPRREDVVNVLTNFYKTKDERWLRLAMLQPDPYWSRFCMAIERTDLEFDPCFSSFDPRLENRVALLKIMDEVFSLKTLAEWAVRLREGNVPWSPVQNFPEVTHDPQARANDYFLPYDHPVYGHIDLVANPIKLSQTREQIKSPAPQFNQHTEEVLLEYGYTWDDIVVFKERGVIA